MATIVIEASGIVRAAAYMAKMADASVGVAPVGRMSSGFISPAMENPLATTTFRAVRAEARPILFVDRGVVSIANAPMRSVSNVESSAWPVGDIFTQPGER